MTDMMVLHEGLLFEIIIEPIGDSGGGVFGRNLIENILESIEFSAEGR